LKIRAVQPSKKVGPNRVERRGKSDEGRYFSEEQNVKKKVVEINDGLRLAFKVKKAVEFFVREIVREVASERAIGREREREKKYIYNDS
jgi:hypothetical protein